VAMTHSLIQSSEGYMQGVHDIYRSFASTMNSERAIVSAVSGVSVRLDLASATFCHRHDSLGRH
jgi:hypothetical protein